MLPRRAAEKLHTENDSFAFVQVNNINWRVHQNVTVVEYSLFQSAQKDKLILE